MASIMEMSLMCRLCLAKDKNQVNIPIFEDPGDIRQIFVKISSCLPIKISRDDQLPKNICDGCGDKLELLYEFWNTSLDSEKTLTAWLKQVKDPAVSAVAQQISKPAETLVKEETDAAEASTYLEPAQESSINEEAEIEEVEPEEPPKKRARRTAAVKAQINIAPESDDEDDNFDNNMDEPDSVDADVIAKLEGESEESDGDEKDPSFADLPGTSTQDQPGTSGLGKDGAEAPLTTNYQPIVKLEALRSDFGCSVCDKDFKTKVALHKHSKVHQQKVTQKCLLCDKTYTNLSRHNRQAHNENDGRNYQCDLCSKYFRHKQGLNYHKIYHRDRKPFQCQFCDRSYITKTHLKTHLRSHPESGVEAFKCEFCQKQITRNVAFQEHRNRHLGIFPAECNICGKCFSGNRSLGQHKSLYHREKNLFMY